MTDVLSVVPGRLGAPRHQWCRIMQPRLEAAARRADSASVIVLEADAGYGKTTAADILSDDGSRIWYTVGREDGDPFVFLAHLLSCVGADTVVDGAGRVSAGSEHLGGSQSDWPRLLDVFIAELTRLDAPLSLVLDDYHHVLRSQVDEVVVRLVERMPRLLRLVITTREHLDLAGWSRLRARGDVVDIGRDVLAFEPAETSRYFRERFKVELTNAEAQLVTEETEGWPIGLSLIGQRLSEQEEEPEALLAALPEGRAAIFEFLREQVFYNLPGGEQSFLLAVSCLAELEPHSCAAVAGTSADVAAEQIHALGLGGAFCLSDGSGRQYLHHLFRDFLQAQLTRDEAIRSNRLAARHFLASNDLEHAARHFVRAGDHDEAANAVERIHGRLLAAGRHATLLDLTDPLVSVLDGHPALRVARSHAFRLACRYADAIDEARRAQTSSVPGSDDFARALEAEVLVHLDTVHPRAAAAVLERVAEGASPSAGAIVWDALSAENQVNSGDLDAAAATLADLRDRHDAHDRSAIELRLLVRRGHLQRARAALGGSGARTTTIAFAHREQAALLAWIDGLLGFGERAAGYARDGIELGADLRSPILSCVCWGRLGLAQASTDALDLEQAAAAFERSLAIADDIDVARFRAEPLIGLSVIAHRLGAPGDTLRYGIEAIETLEAAGDRYLAAMARLGIGAGLADQGHPQARRWLAEARHHAAGCGDSYIPLVADQWAAHLALAAGAPDEFATHATAALRATSKLGLDELWVSPPWVAAYDRRARTRWLEAAGDLDGVGEYARYLQRRLRRPGAAAARSVADDPSTAKSLQIRTLGAFQVVRDDEPIEPSAWKRRKAKELLWLLCAADRHSLTREQAIEALWPDDFGDAVGGRLRVALHALQLALEPDRRHREPTRFVLTSAERVWLNPDEVEVDIDEFRRLADLSRRSSGEDQLQAALDALDMYHGPFLADEVYLEWVGPTRTRVANQFRDLALDAAGQLIERGEHADAVRLGRRALDTDPFHDESCRTIVSAYLAAGDRVSATQVYEEWQARLRDELGVDPDWSPATL